jgi:hypothetical protein
LFDWRIVAVAAQTMNAKTCGYGDRLGLAKSLVNRVLKRFEYVLGIVLLILYESGTNLIAVYSETGKCTSVVNITNTHSYSPNGKNKARTE